MTFAETREKLLTLTKKALKESTGEDQLITMSICAIEELDKAANLLVRRLREWYELYSPEFSKAVGDNEAFVRLILEKSRDEQLKEQDITLTMGADLASKDVEHILRFASTIKALYTERDNNETYLSTLMRSHCPNVLAVAGVTIGARLLRNAGSLKHLAFIQASTIQLYGAEKALFRHIKTGAKPPKHGHLIHHPLVASSKEKGKVARALADKISIAAKVDYFKGEYIGDSLRADLDKKFGERP